MVALHKQFHTRCELRAVTYLFVHITVKIDIQVPSKFYQELRACSPVEAHRILRPKTTKKHLRVSKNTVTDTHNFTHLQQPISNVEKIFCELVFQSVGDFLTSGGIMKLQAKKNFK